MANAVAEFAACLRRPALRRILLASKEWPIDAPLRGKSKELRAEVLRLHSHSLCRFLNSAPRQALENICKTSKLSTDGTIGELRARLWLYGAMLEAGTDEALGSPWQPIPIVLGGRLVFQGPLHGLSPPSHTWPRPIPQKTAPPCQTPEPESLEELLENANRLLGVYLGERGADKGFFGAQTAIYLGVPERGLSEPDWRGEVEIKTVPVVRDRAGWWRVKEDPAIAMADVNPRRKLEQVLWIARVADHPGSPLLSWYFQKWDPIVAELAHRYLHHRPKGAAGTSNKGWYLQKRFFLQSGFLKSLNG